jgi:hypothetical protein
MASEPPLAMADVTRTCDETAASVLPVIVARTMPSSKPNDLRKASISDLPVLARKQRG